MRYLLSIILLLIPLVTHSATGDAETVIGKTDTAITTILGKAGTGIASVMGKNYTDGDGGSGVSDDFASDTSANYTAIAGGMSVSSGKAHGTAEWDDSILYHETALSSVNHYVQATVGRVSTTAYDLGSVIARSNGTAYYRLYIDGDTLRVNRTGTYIDGCSYAGGYDSGNTSYLLKFEVNGTGASISLKGYVDSTLRIDCTDTAAGRLTTGSYVGFGINRNAANSDSTIDDLSGGAL